MMYCLCISVFSCASFSHSNFKLPKIKTFFANFVAKGTIWSKLCIFLQGDGTNHAKRLYICEKSLKSRSIYARGKISQNLLSQ